MAEDEMYALVCKDRFDKLHEDVRLILTKQDFAEQRFQEWYKDNGGESPQSRLNRHDGWIKRTNKIIWTIGIAVLGIITGWIKSKWF